MLSKEVFLYGIRSTMTKLFEIECQRKNSLTRIYLVKAYRVNQCHCVYIGLAIIYFPCIILLATATFNLQITVGIHRRFSRSVLFIMEGKIVTFCTVNTNIAVFKPLVTSATFLGVIKTRGSIPFLSLQINIFALFFSTFKILVFPFFISVLYISGI